MKKRSLIHWVPVLAAVFLLLSAHPVLAASGLVQSKNTTSSITVKWSDMTSTLKKYKKSSVKIFAYEIRWYDADGSLEGKSPVLKPSARSYKITGLSSNTSYKVKLRMGYRVENTGETPTSALSKTMFTKPGTPKILSYSHRDNQKGLQVRWQAVGGSNPVRYQYQLASPAGKKLRTGITTTSNLVMTKSKYYNRACKIRVRAFVTDSSLKKYYGGWSSYEPIVPQPILYSDTNRYGVQANGTLKLKWNKVIHANRYEIWVSKTSATKGYKKAGSVPSPGTSTIAVSVPTWNGRDSFETDTLYYVMVLAVSDRIGKSEPNYYMTTQLVTFNN